VSLQGNLLFGILDGVGTMTDVASNSKGVITADGACENLNTSYGLILTTIRGLTRARLQGVGSTQHDTAGLHSVQTLPDHSKDRTREHVLDHTGEEGLPNEISVVCTSDVINKGGS